MLFIIYLIFLKFRSKPNGSYLYSSASLGLVGNNDLISILRILTCIELFTFSDFYYNHPLFKDIFDKNKAHFKANDSIVNMSASFEALDSLKKGALLVKEDAITNSPITQTYYTAP